MQLSNNSIQKSIRDAVELVFSLSAVQAKSKKADCPSQLPTGDYTLRNSNRRRGREGAHSDLRTNESEKALDALLVSSNN